MGKYCVSYSGGKDCVLAMDLYMNQTREKPYCLIITIKEDRESWTHGLDFESLDRLSKSLGIDIRYIHCAVEDYEKEFAKCLSELRDEGVEECVFGDIYIERHLKWNRDICERASVKAVHPLGNMSSEDVVGLLLDKGYKAEVIKVNRELEDKGLIGREVDETFLEDIRLLNEERKKEGLEPIDIAGENGEYHTLCYDGPLFRGK